MVIKSALIGIFPIILILYESQCHLIKPPNRLSVCYYRNWVQYKESKARFLPEDIDPNLCSVINYHAMRINISTHKMEGRQKNDIVMLQRLNALKKDRPSLKVFISVGGWKHEKLPRFSRMVQYRSTRKIFIRTIIDFLRDNQLDGVNLDWEYPGSRGSPSLDKWRFSSLLKELRVRFQKDAMDNDKPFPYMLTLSVAASRRKIEKGYDIPIIKNYVDWVDVMAYNLRGSWSETTDCPTIVTGPLPNVPDSILAWLNGGMPACKINLGLAVYGRSLQLKSPDLYGIGAPTMGKGPAGMFTKKPGILAYYEICLINWMHMTSQKASVCGTPYASSDDLWVSYENPDSIAFKVSKLANQLNLNGISFWALDFDDFSGTNCGEGRYPLLTAAVKELNRPRELII